MTLKMTTAQVVETSVTNSLSKDYLQPDDHKTNNFLFNHYILYVYSKSTGSAHQESLHEILTLQGTLSQQQKSTSNGYMRQYA